jgi:pimeloyl-CoA synthetase
MGESSRRAWKWAYEWVACHGLGSILIRNEEWRFQKLIEGDTLKAIWLKDPPTPIQESLEKRRDREIRAQLYPEISLEVQREENDRRGEALRKRLKEGAWNTIHPNHWEDYSWEKIKKKLKERGPYGGLELLAEWTGQNLERSKKSGVRWIPDFPGWYEIERKTLKKRLGIGKKGNSDISMGFKEVPIPRMTQRKGWSFLGDKANPKPVLLPELPITQNESWEVTTRASQWVPLVQAKEDVIESRNDRVRVTRKGCSICEMQPKIIPGDVIELGKIERKENQEIWVWDVDHRPQLMQTTDTQLIIRERIEWIRRGHIQLYMDGERMEGIKIEGALTLHFKWTKKVYCTDDERSYSLWVDQVPDWIKANGDQRIFRNGEPWDEKTINPEDSFHMLGRLRSSPHRRMRA